MAWRFLCFFFSFSFFFPKDISFTIWYLWKWKKKRKAIAIRPAFGGEDTRLPTKQTRTQVRSLVVGSCLLLLSRSMEKTMCPILKTRQSEHRFSCLAPGQDWTRLFMRFPLLRTNFCIGERRLVHKLKEILSLRFLCWHQKKCRLQALAKGKISLWDDMEVPEESK